LRGIGNLNALFFKAEKGKLHMKWLRRAESKVTARPSAPLRVWADKAVAPEQVQAFWRKVGSGEKVQKRLLPGTKWARDVLAVSPSALTTVRRFYGEKNAALYMRNSRLIVERLMAENPRTFVIQPVQFISRHGSMVLERVYPGVDMEHFGKRIGRYFWVLQRRLQRKGIDLGNERQFRRVKDALENAYKEAQEIRKRCGGLDFTTSKQNYLLLDFDPTTRKVLLAIIDHEFPGSKTER